MHLLALLACISSSTPELLIEDTLVFAPTLVQEVLPNQLPLEQLYNLAQSITVKVHSGDNWGSGTLIHRQGQVYTVLTNLHVLTAGEPYWIETPDGKVYSAYKLGTVPLESNDLAILHFRSTNANYAVASVDNASHLEVGDEVFASGFPFTLEPSSKRDFVLTTGQVSLLLAQALVGGYQFGYNNDIQKGMSGGPILNRKGQVVGINGMHKYPLWGDPYVFKDGSQPAFWLRELMVNSSWGIPIETFAQLVQEGRRQGSRGDGETWRHTRRGDRGERKKGWENDN